MRTRIIKNNEGVIIPVIEKADISLKQDDSQGLGEYQLIYPTVDIGVLKDIAAESTIIPQCVEAYKTNICGFGINPVPKDDKIDNPQEESEKNVLKDILDNLNYDMPFKDVLKEVIDFREQCGIAYMEVIRNNLGEVVEVNALDSEFITQTTQGPIEEFDTIINGKNITRRKRFRKFKQYVNNVEVWFKEFGFPKFMDYRTGEITDTDNGEYEANEILVFKLGNEIYGTPRWWGQSMNVQGSKMAEYVNYNYFLEGRHTPVMIIVRGGTLSDKSWTDLQTYMNDIKGYKNSHGFIVLEVEAVEQGISALNLGDEKGNKIDVEIKDLSPMLQQDALFTEYLDRNESGVQSSFNLPDIYVGKTKEYNRATAYAAIEVTEKQVFQPERNSLAWIINNILLSGYAFKSVKVELVAPKFSNVDDLFKILTVVEKAGGLNPLLAQKLLQKYAADIEFDEYKESWGNIPVQLINIVSNTPREVPQQGEVQKAEQRQVDILKDVRNALIKLTDKYNI